MNADTTNYHESFKFSLGETLQIMNFNNKACRDGSTVSWKVHLRKLQGMQTSKPGM